MSNSKTYLTTVILFSLTLLGLIYLWQCKNVSLAKVKLESIPLTLGEWKGEDIPIDERIYELLETKDVLMREYSNVKGERVVLAIVYSGVNRASFHPPEICYLGGGRELLKKDIENVEAGPAGKTSRATMQVNKLLMEDQAGKEIAWYWFSAGSRITSSYYLQQCYFIWDELRRNPQGGTLIRVSTRVADGSREAGAPGKDFIKQIAPILLDYLS